MAQALTINARHRTERGKGAARSTRRAGRIPAVIYGHGREPESLSVSAVDFDKLLKDVSGGSTVIEVDVDGTKVTTLIRELQRHPVRRSIIHIDFYEIHAGEVITVRVPIHLNGIPEGVRNSGGILEQFNRELQIEVLPKNIPEVIDVDVTDLDLNDTIHVSDLNVPHAKILDVETTTICSVLPPRVEEEEVPEEEDVIAEEDVEEPELIRKTRDDEESEGGDEA